jgi:hypothetical protein
VGPAKATNQPGKTRTGFADLTKEFFATAKIAETAADRKLAIGLFNGISIAVVYKPLGTHGPPGTADRTRKCNAGVNFRELSGLRATTGSPKTLTLIIATPVATIDNENVGCAPAPSKGRRRL